MKITAINKRARTPLRPDGFTLIEALAVLLVMGIMAVVLVSRADMSLNSTVVAEAEALKAQFRYAQSRAMTSGNPWGISIANNSYSMFYKDGTRTTVTMPGEADSSRNLGALGITVTGAVVSFDSWGRPCTGDDGSAARTGNLVLTMSKGGASRTITITKNTGFIP